MIGIRVVALLAVLSLAACATEPPPAEHAPPQDDAAVTEAIDSALAQHFRAAMVPNGIDSVATFLTGDAIIIEPGRRETRSEWAARVREMFGAEGRLLSYALRRIDLFIHGDAAYDLGEYDETLLLPSGEVTVEGYYFIRWERGADGRWRMDRQMSGPRAGAE